MQLIDLRTEVLNHGFDPIQYGSRINTYLNDALNLVARRVNYYVDESTYTFSTVNAQAIYPWPANLARFRSLSDTNRNQEMQYVDVRDIDRSGQTTGPPYAYAITGPNFELYPTPDNPYPMQLRYWLLPPALVNDTDVPNLPVDWHHILWEYAVGICYRADDDAQMAQFWQQQFQNTLAMFAADQKFPDTDGPMQAEGMWDAQRSLAPAHGWTLYGAGW